MIKFRLHKKKSLILKTLWKHCENPIATVNFLTREVDILWFIVVYPNDLVVETCPLILVSCPFLFGGRNKISFISETPSIFGTTSFFVSSLIDFSNFRHIYLFIYLSTYLKVLFTKLTTESKKKKKQLSEWKKIRSDTSR